MRWLSLVLLLTGCATANRTDLLEIDRQFSNYSVAHGAPAAFVAYMAENATLLPNGAEPVNGRKAIGDSLAPLANGTLTWQPRQAEVSRSGELGYTWGTYEYRTTNGVSYGKYCTIWHKQADGSWKANLDVGNKSPPPQ